MPLCFGRLLTVQFQVRNMSGSSYVVYELHIRLDADAWKVFRRFRWALPLVVPFCFLGLFASCGSYAHLFPCLSN